ncbi:MAG: LTA synthase family protein [Deltaproteobacteria bacterium]|nr:LTA synthase family protein [Deltaproteobacteria bacterium]MBW2117282.1 LTA synthase family protein [Deltaproteobacteria bacterium]
MKRLGWPEFICMGYLFIGIMLAGSFCRLWLLLSNRAMAVGIPSTVILKSLLIGMRFDLLIASYIMLPVAAWQILPKIGWQYSKNGIRFLFAFLLVVLSPVIFIGIAEAEFYREFHDRFNQLAIQYVFDQPGTVIKMVWHGYPVVRYLIATAILMAGIWWLLKKVPAKGLPVEFSWKQYFGKSLPFGLVVLALLVFGARGGFQTGPPLRWGDAYFSKHTYANHLALNGIFTLAQAAQNWGGDKSSHYWLARLPQHEALEITREMVLQTGDQLLLARDYPLLKKPGIRDSSVSFTTRPQNVVLIQMESLSAQFIGALGSTYGATPVFDQLARQGILFDHFFSQGTHTHQALFASLCSFPNLPAHEYLMQEIQGQQHFRSLPEVLLENGFDTLYVYNGSFRWDNQEGFFRHQGMKHFVGIKDFRQPKFTDSTWGVSDEDMFLRGITEIDHLTEKGPAFAFLQSLSNHAPYELPPPAPFKDITGPASLIPRLNGLRYADWALGRFFDLAAKKPWFKQTLFLIYGDHSFAFQRPKALLDLTRQHIPLLVYYPGDTRFAGQVIHAIGSQVDILPTILGLLKIDTPIQSWGRDLFRLDPDDPGWALIKPSGGEPTVAFIKGDKFLVEAPGIKPVLYHYSLYPWDTQPITKGNDGLCKKYKLALESYVETGIDALRRNVAGYEFNVCSSAGNIHPQSIEDYK